MKWQPEAGSVGGHPAPIRFSYSLDFIKELTSLLVECLDSITSERIEIGPIDQSLINQCKRRTSLFGRYRCLLSADSDALGKRVRLHPLHSCIEAAKAAFTCY